MSRVTELNFIKDKEYIFISHQLHFQDNSVNRHPKMYHTSGYFEISKCKFIGRLDFGRLDLSKPKIWQFYGNYRCCKSIVNVDKTPDFESNNCTVLYLYDTLDYVFCNNIEDYLLEIKNIFIDSNKSIKNINEITISTNFVYLIIENQNGYCDKIYNKINDLVNMIGLIG